MTAIAAVIASIGKMNQDRENAAKQKSEPKKVQQKGVHCLYTNWKGETEWRKIIPMSIVFGSNQYHPEEQWLMIVWDLDKDAERTYAMKDIKEWKVP